MKEKSLYISMYTMQCVSIYGCCSCCVIREKTRNVVFLWIYKEGSLELQRGKEREGNERVFLGKIYLLTFSVVLVSSLSLSLSVCVVASLILKRKGLTEPASEPPGLGWFVICEGV